MKQKIKAAPATKKVVEETTTITKEIIQPPVEKKPTWEIKDRVYVLKDGLSPLTYTVKSSNIYFFDEEKGFERELKYTTNQRTPFVDEFKGDAQLAHVVFLDGVLTVPKSKQTLQKLLSLYHPQRDRLFFEFDAEAKAESELDRIEYEIEALNAAMSMEIDQIEAIVRTEAGSKTSMMTSSELKRDLIKIAKKDPILFLELANDENIQIRNMGIRAVEANIIKLSADQRTFTWGSTNKKLLTVPYEENPYSALTAFFKTDEGVEVYSAVEKRLN